MTFLHIFRKLYDAVLHVVLSDEYHVDSRFNTVLYWVWVMGVRIETEAFIDVGKRRGVERDDSHRGLQTKFYMFCFVQIQFAFMLKLSNYFSLPPPLCCCAPLQCREDSLVGLF